MNQVRKQKKRRIADRAAALGVSLCERVGVTAGRLAAWKRRARAWRRRGGLVLALVCFGVVALGVRSGCRSWRSRNDTSRYDAYIAAAARRHGISPALVKAVIWKESRFKAASVGLAEEVGLMQIMPGVVTDWHTYHRRPRPDRRALFDPQLNIEIGTWYLARAMRRWRSYRSADILALAEYNAGGSHAREWAPEDPQRELRLEDISFPGTRDYIRAVRNKWHEFEKERSSSG